MDINDIAKGVIKNEDSHTPHIIILARAVLEQQEEIANLSSALEWIADFRFSTAGAATMMKEKANRTLSEMEKK